MRRQVRIYNAAGITGRHGVPDGWAGKKKLINQINALAREDAVAIMDHLKSTKQFEPDNQEAEEALLLGFEVMRAQKHTPTQAPVPLYDVKERLAAANMILKYTQKVPTSNSNVAITRAEDWLDSLATAAGRK